MFGAPRTQAYDRGRDEMIGMTRSDPAAKRHARQLRGEMSEAERRLWGHLRGQQLAGLRFRRQHALGRYVLDFVCLESKLVVELACQGEGV